MRHFIIFKYGRDSWTKIYEYHGSIELARQYQKTLSDTMKTVLILVEVV